VANLPGNAQAADGGQGYFSPAEGSLESLEDECVSLIERSKGEEMTDFQVTWLDHVSVLITDIERSRHFYRNILGLKEIARPRTFHFSVLWFDLGNQHLHLLLKDCPDTVSPRHFALRVADAEQARAHFRHHGIATEETTPIPGADRFFISDPDSNRIEIIQWHRPYDPARDGVG
jgi:catechol 2,3-dioxygenase-like lactoylglutathione lyase family enzyme